MAALSDHTVRRGSLCSFSKPNWTKADFMQSHWRDIVSQLFLQCSTVVLLNEHRPDTVSSVKRIRLYKTNEAHTKTSACFREDHNVTIVHILEFNDVIVSTGEQVFIHRYKKRQFWKEIHKCWTWWDPLIWPKSCTCFEHHQKITWS